MNKESNARELIRNMKILAYEKRIKKIREQLKDDKLNG